MALYPAFNHHSGNNSLIILERPRLVLRGHNARRGAERRPRKWRTYLNDVPSKPVFATRVGGHADVLNAAESAPPLTSAAT
jgi:hypothetical protein